MVFFSNIRYYAGLMIEFGGIDYLYLFRENNLISGLIEVILF